VNNRRILGLVGGIVLLLVVWLTLVTGQKRPMAKRSSAVSAQELYKQAVALKKDQDLLNAREWYKRIIAEYPGFENIAGVQKELEALNLEIIFSNVPTPQTVIHEVQSGDTLGKLASKYGTTVELIKKSNNLATDTIRLGQKLRIWTGQFNIFVDKSQNILVLKNGNDVVKIYQVSTGEHNNTPTGTFTITNKLVNPVWYKAGAIIPPESPQNVLGSRWLGFDLLGYGIHGTVDPESIGRQVTAGCVRMRNADVEELYSLVSTGTQVVIVD
jgi:lipoprotein-anchoring transpeptidase ErfK/SrfK